MSNWPVLPYPGNSLIMTVPFNRLSTGAAATSSFGGQAYYGVLNGLTLSVGSGLALAVAAGQAFAGALVEFAGGTVSVPNSTSNVWIWLSQGGALSYTTSTTPPSGAPTLIGNCTTSGGNVIAVDYSGVVYVSSPIPVRNTGDFTAPGDTPALAGLLTRTAGGLWLFDGTAHRRIQGESRLQLALAAASTTLTAAQAGSTFLDFSGTPGAAATVVLPLAAGRQYTVRNGVSGGYSITFQGPTGGSVTVANAKTAQVVCDGTNWIRVTADT